MNPALAYLVADVAMGHERLQVGEQEGNEKVSRAQSGSVGGGERWSAAVRGAAVAPRFRAAIVLQPGPRRPPARPQQGEGPAVEEMLPKDVIGGRPSL